MPWAVTGFVTAVAAAVITFLLDVKHGLQDDLTREMARADEADRRRAEAEDAVRYATAAQEEERARATVASKVSEDAQRQAQDMQEKVKQAIESVNRVTKEAADAREGQRRAEVARASEEQARARSKDAQDRLERQAQRYRAFTSGQATRAADRDTNLYTSIHFQLRYDGTALHVTDLSMQLNKAAPRFPKIDQGQRFQLRAYLWVGTGTGSASTVCCWLMEPHAGYRFRESDAMKLAPVANTAIGEQRIAFELKSVPDGTPVLVGSSTVSALIDKAD
jgi:hypothetical protein